MRENLNFILIFSVMMAAIMLLHGCTQTDTRREPLTLVLLAECNPDGGATFKFEGIDAVTSEESVLDIKDPRQIEMGD